MSANSVTKRRRFFGKAAILVGEPAWVLFSFFFVAALVFGWIIASFSWLEDAAGTTLGQMVSGATVYVLVVLLVILPILASRNKQYLKKILGVVKKPTKEVLWLPLLLWAAYMAATLIASYAATFLPWVDSQQMQDVGFSGISQPHEYLLAFFALVVIPPIAEELLFRGYLFGRLREKFGFWLTTIVVSLVFGVVHLQWNVGIDVFVLSIFLCYLRERTGSIWASMVLHGIKNGLAYFLLFIAPLLGLSLL